jgi:NADH dehydrogenase [ubiquinone] 1 alpha subcomplex assembly factor 7
MGDLRARIADRIRREGPITFAAFMDAALYDDEEGFYARPPVGSRGDFVTSPHVSAAFGDLIGVQLRGCRDLLGTPKPFHVVEAGAGDGTLARRLIPGLGEDVVYRAVERSAGSRDALERAGIDAAPTLSELGSFTGCVIANELLDNLAFHRLRCTAAGVVEIVVGLDGERLVELEAEPTVELGAADIPIGEERPVSPASLAFVRDAINVLERGYVILYDYDIAPTRAYERHRVHGRVLDEPGTADITAGVDFAAIAAEAAKAGATVWGPRSQRDVLYALGYEQWMTELREARLRAEQEHRSRDTLRLISERTRAPLLVDLAHLGSLKVIAFGVGITQAPPGFDVG